MPDPEDIVQDALSKLHRWLTTPGRNAVDDGMLTLAKKFVETSCRDLLKMNAARKRGGGRAPGPMPETGMQPPSPGTGPVSYVARGERRSRLLQALERLDELDRRIVLMRTEQELSFVEIGKSVDLSENAARMRFNRALKVLRPVLEASLPTEDRR
jgi:RNA polymerase sigma-70 factor (ECF subfamily)